MLLLAGAIVSGPEHGTAPIHAFLTSSIHAILTSPIPAFLTSINAFLPSPANAFLSSPTNAFLSTTPITDTKLNRVEILSLLAAHRANVNETGGRWFTTLQLNNF